MKKKSKHFANLNDEKKVEMLPSLFRTTLVYNTVQRLWKIRNL